MNILNKVTRKTLERNKVRTLVTIIGIVLSAAMFTAVMVSVTSMQNYLLRCCEATDGSWYAKLTDADSAELQNIASDSDISEYAYLENMGYAVIESRNAEKPYLYIGGISGNFTDIMAVNITEGRMPESPDEIILPNHLITNGGVRDYSVGDTITLDIGQREFEGEILTQKNPYYGYDYETNEVIYNEEKLVDTGKQTFTIVGYYERGTFEPYTAPGYTALTMCDDSADAGYDVFYKTEKTREIYTVAQKIDPSGERTLYNSDYLRYYGVSMNDGFNSMLYSMAAILSVLIMVGSVSLIYNAFSISVSERTKQFGILKSIGATKRQMRKSVIYEGMLLSAVGIPIGILAGILGMFITFKLIGGLVDMMFVSSVEVEFGLHVTWPAIVVSAVICIITVFISASIPAKKAARRPAIEAIRQSDDVAIKRSKVRTNPLTYKLFGFEGMLASKNFKRNRKKYRVTVLSLFVSLVLFISASSFCNYMTEGVNMAVQDYNYDISYAHVGDDLSEASVEDMKSIIENTDEITDVNYIAEDGGWLAELASDGLVSDEALQAMGDFFGTDENGNPSILVSLYFVEDVSYMEYLESEGLDADVFMNAQSPVGVIYDSIILYDGKYTKYDVFGQERFTMDIQQKVPAEDGGEETKRIEINVGASVNHTPMGLYENNYSGYVYIMYPYSAYRTVMGVDTDPYEVIYYMKSDNHIVSNDKLCETLDSMDIGGYSVNDAAQSVAVTQALVTILKVFSYGFIVLISLISLANVFNTISTNIGLRRREFAMLKSVGMTKKGFNRMMNYECVLYGMKGIIFGIPVSLVINWLMSRSMDFGVDLGVIIPWKSIIIAVASVFIVVFATMLYSMSKIRHDNTVETLKNENL